MKNSISILIAILTLTTTLQIRLYHDNRKGYSYNITGPSVEEVIESDQKMRQYLRSLVPQKKAVPAPPVSAPKPAPIKK
ncbi:MAG: hypothetical protein HY787_27595 [Deltaproteobacteria bacterium]|nr:hypothetical protein [Deltaproteobacteria bacterium]